MLTCMGIECCPEARAGRTFCKHLEQEHPGSQAAALEARIKEGRAIISEHEATIESLSQRITELENENAELAWRLDRLENPT